MNAITIRASLATMAIGGLLALAVGCGPTGTPTEPAKGTDKAAAPTGKKVDDHSEWWCAEHGIPEEECSMCSKKVAKECKAKNDWCDKHDRAKSQCFKCDPTLKEKFAAKYEAKYGTKPPPIGEEEDEKNEKK